MDSARPFRAFVSYCHADAAFAARLQRRLEGYRLPRRLADKVAPLPGQGHGRIGPIFRDRADLSAVEDLSAAVREAIAASSALVVVASPDAAGSRWVALEIRLFRELHPGAPVLVALVRGEPEEALPDALRIEGIEPLAADFQRDGDGRRLAFLKIVAGLTGLPFDALVQRDAQRQLRRVTAITLGALAMVLVMSALLVIARRAEAEAEHQRIEAEHRRADAEGLVEFMLTNLRDQLKGVGRPEVMAAVNERAMVYYTAQGDLGRLPDESLDRRARVLHAMGEDDANAGDLKKALLEFTEAHRTTAAILAKQPNNPDRIFAHAQSEYYVGLIARERHDRVAATRHWQGYLDQARALAAKEPRSVRGLLEQGYAQGNLCDLNLEDDFDVKAAAAQCAASVRFEQAALRKSPDDREVVAALANRHGYLAEIYFALRRYDDSLASCRAEAALLDRLLALDPRNFEYALRRSWADIGMANVWVATAEPARAVATMKQSLARHPTVFNGVSKEERVIETRLRAHLFLARALRDLGQDYGSELAEAERQASRMAAFGSDFTVKAKKMQASIWS
jgi:hypothetical protein